MIFRDGLLSEHSQIDDNREHSLDRFIGGGPKREARRYAEMAQSASLYPATILIVENEAIVRMELAAQLTALGLKVLVAGDADEAIDLLDAHAEIELLLTDVTMPGSMDGVRLAHHVRKRWPRSRSS